MFFAKKNIRAMALALLVTQAAPLSALSAPWYKNPWALTSIGSAATSLAFFIGAASLYNKTHKPSDNQTNMHIQNKPVLRAQANACIGAGAAFLVLAGFCLSRVK